LCQILTLHPTLAHIYYLRHKSILLFAAGV
jgi:hypothetical protein